MSTESKKTTTTDSSTAPWAPQAGALTSAFNDAQNAYNKASTAVAPTNFTAQFTPEQLSTFQSMLGYTNGNTIPGQNAATGGALSGSGTNATTQGLTGLLNFNPSAATDPSTLVAAAKQYVDGQNIDGQVNDAMLNARQTARDVTLPGITQNAALNGDTNNSRTGIAQGLVERGLAEQADNLGATLRNSAFENGLALASGNANTGNAQRLGALSSASGTGVNAANSGVAANSGSIGDQSNLFGLANTAGSGLQASQQAYLDNMLKQYQALVSAPYDATNGLMGIIGANNWGSNTVGTGTQTSDPSIWETVGGLLGAGGSAAKAAGGLGWQPFSK